MQRLDHRLFVHYRRVFIEKCVCALHTICFECAVAIRLEDIDGKRSHFTGGLATTSTVSEVSVEQRGLWRRMTHRE
jgi:hypothetical protein